MYRLFILSVSNGNTCNLGNFQHRIVVPNLPNFHGMLTSRQCKERGIRPLNFLPCTVKGLGCNHIYQHSAISQRQG